jgi:hypothetical protein
VCGLIVLMTVPFGQTEEVGSLLTRKQLMTLRKEIFHPARQTALGGNGLLSVVGWYFDSNM